jgi:hypothetical protein
VGSVDEKLRRGFDLAARAGGDDDLRGVALLALHGALEDHLDETLGRMPELSPEDRAALDGPGYGWVTRANLALRYSLITREQRQAILDANSQRQEFAHGAPYAGGQRAIDTYATLVAELCGRRPTAAHAARPAARPARPAAQPTAAVAARPGRPAERTTVGASSGWDNRAKVRSARRSDLLPGDLPVRGLLATAVLLVLLFVGWRALSWSPPEQEPVISGAPLASAIPSSPTAPPPTATPAVREARIVNLGGAIGFMHEPAGFSTPTQPPQLPEGTLVRLVDVAPVSAEGATWVRVAFGGYEGWVPETNLEAVAPADAATPSPAGP